MDQVSYGINKLALQNEVISLLSANSCWLFKNLKTKIIFLWQTIHELCFFKAFTLSPPSPLPLTIRFRKLRVFLTQDVSLYQH